MTASPMNIQTNSSKDYFAENMKDTLQKDPQMKKFLTEIITITGPDRDKILVAIMTIIEHIRMEALTKFELFANGDEVKNNIKQLTELSEQLCEDNSPLARRLQDSIMYTTFAMTVANYNSRQCNVFQNQQLTQNLLSLFAQI